MPIHIKAVKRSTIHQLASRKVLMILTGLMAVKSCFGVYKGSKVITIQKRIFTIDALYSNTKKV